MAFENETTNADPEIERLRTALREARTAEEILTAHAQLRAAHERRREEQQRKERNSDAPDKPIPGYGAMWNWHDREETEKITGQPCFSAENWICSNCNFHIAGMRYTIYRYKYCPNCGTKMTNANW